MIDAPPTLLALSAYLLSRAGKSARARVAVHLAAEGLRLWHMAVLAALADFGPHVQGDLAARLGIDRSDMVKVVDELSEAGFVERTRDPADRRRVHVSLTPAGEAALRRLVSDAGAVDDSLLRPLDPEERATLRTLLLKILAAN
ncbi:MarR family winged helix-turn-helix transcriptional regulator [Nonomuraea soli]|uniref:DNA-binding MarR family transcriptional regulator n=1 Tax=Nonomuraea soli TaxID=1032476 RepID=A0A7W0CER7_9ACTN|nr:MarR family winged helix-turn-helix transcriptional regulator [Nonomuraea soli]MBA2889836.1 DNA-binding MarR family transcriptional regulator [Nonomuraea soli]